MQFMAHKRSLVLMKNVSFAHEFMIPQFYREALHLQWIEGGNPTPPDWIESLKKDTNLALLYEDHPITGELYDLEHLDAGLNEKKIFSIRVSYGLFRSAAPFNLRPYSIRLCVLEDGQVLALFGQKVKLPVVFSNTVKIPNPSQLAQVVKEGLAKKSFDSSIVKNFETKLEEKNIKIWSYKNPRLWDRSLFVLSQRHADWFKSYLIEKNVKYESHVRTLSECEHGFMKPLWNWWPDAPEGDEQRGFVILSAECLHWTETYKLVENAIQSAPSQLHWKW